MRLNSALERFLAFRFVPPHYDATKAQPGVGEQFLPDPTHITITADGRVNLLAAAPKVS